jgi:hypothetical protein
MVDNKQKEIAILAAKRLGYRLPVENSDRMVKSFGRMIYILFLKGDEFRLSNFFYDVEGKLFCYDSCIFKESDFDKNFEWALSEAEESIYHPMGTTCRSEFKNLGFLTNKEITESFCGL